ncbi:MAG: cation-translocating P-type ATPase [Gemmataceae bacterium]|nr:cation-translocating P-type ATPase [Gemmataceae bacterium]
MRTAAQTVQELAITPDRGLTTAAVEASRRGFGANVLTPLPRESLWKKFLEKFDEPIIKILLAAALLSMVVDLFQAEPVMAGWSVGLLAALVAGVALARRGEWIPTVLFASAFILFIVGLSGGHVLVEGLAVMIAVVLATGVAFISEYRSDREFEMLNSRKDSLRSKVLRDGEIHAVSLEEIVVGDVVLLEMGDEIPADGRIVKATEMRIDQSLMTGESDSVRKTASRDDDASHGPEHPGCVYRGTQVVDGMGQMIVTEVGDATYLGQIARRLGGHIEEEETAGENEEARVKRKLSISKELTPLQLKLQHLAALISRVGYVAAAAIFLAEVARGIWVGEVYLPQSTDQAVSVFGELLGYFVTMVIVIVVAVPEGLPMSVTVSLALAMRKMTRANSLVRQLVACETIGSATVICSDKTGTLTQNKMQVDRLFWDGHLLARGQGDWPKLDAGPPWPRDDRPIHWLALNAAVNSSANLERREGRLLPIGNSTEASLLMWLHESGVEYVPLRQQFPLLYQLHFSSERKRMTSVVKAGGTLTAMVKGAPEIVLSHCAAYLDEHGRVHPLTADVRSNIERNIQQAARLAMRTLAFAHRPLPPGTPEDEEALHEMADAIETDLVFTGFVGIRDPLRLDVKAAIDECRVAGIDVKMITGDNVETARAIGYEIGLVPSPDAPIDIPGSAVMTSARFNELSDADLSAALPSLRIVARARPLDKYRLVSLLQARGEVVAVTGDGTNDAPALKKADVGLAMGIAGTEVSKEASKIVLLDDAFSTIVKAVHWGRSLYENIQRFIQFQLTINVSALAITFLGVLLYGVKAPFTVLQLLWINVIMDTFASIALCSEPPRAGLMQQKPKRKDENIVTPAMTRTIFATAAFFVIVMLGLLLLMRGSPEQPGVFAGEGAWSAEIGSSATAIERGQIESKSGHYFVPLPGHPETKVGATITFTVLQVTLFFTIYVFFQVWNQINCRSLTPETSGFAGLHRNPTFLSIAAVIAVGQFLIVTLGGSVFKVQPLTPMQWLAVIGGTASVLVFAEVARRIRVASSARQAPG